MNKIYGVLTLFSFGLLLTGCSTLPSLYMMPIEHAINPNFRDGNGGFSEIPKEYSGYATLIHPDGRKEIIYIK